MSSLASAIASEGFAVVPGVLDPTEVEQAREALGEVFESEDDIAAERRWITPAYRVAYALPAKHPTFLDLCRPSPLVAAAVEVLGSDVLLAGFNGMAMVPAGEGQALHRDHRDLTPGSTLYLHSVIALDPFTEATGATRIIPASHLDPAAAPDEDAPRHVELAVGDAVVFDATCLHAGSANVTDRPRRALHVLFCRRWVQPHWDLPASLRPDDADGLDDERRHLLGFERVPARYDHAARRSFGHGWG